MEFAVDNIMKTHSLQELFARKDGFSHQNGILGCNLNDLRSGPYLQNKHVYECITNKKLVFTDPLISVGDTGHDIVLTGEDFIQMYKFNGKENTNFSDFYIRDENGVYNQYKHYEAGFRSEKKFHHWWNQELLLVVTWLKDSDKNQHKYMGKVDKNFYEEVIVPEFMNEEFNKISEIKNNIINRRNEFFKVSDKKVLELLSETNNKEKEIYKKMNNLPLVKELSKEVENFYMKKYGHLITPKTK